MIYVKSQITDLWFDIVGEEFVLILRLPLYGLG